MGEGRINVATFLDSLIIQRDTSSLPTLCGMRELDKRVEAVNRLVARHPNLRAAMFDQISVIQSYESIKSCFLVSTK